MLSRADIKEKKSTLDIITIIITFIICITTTITTIIIIIISRHSPKRPQPCPAP